MLTSVDNRLSRKMANCGLVCSLLVVATHSMGGAGETGIVGHLYHWFSRCLASISVPFFFICSGFFLARRMDERGWWQRALRKRVQTLLIPYAIWLGVGFLLTNCIGLMTSMILNRPISSCLPVLTVPILDQLGCNMGQFPHYCGRLWYVRALFLFVCIAPIFKVLVRKLGGFWIASMFCVYAFYVCLATNAEIASSTVFRFWGAGWPVMGMLYFPLGVYLWYHPVRLTESLTRWLLIVSVLCALVTSYLMLCSSNEIVRACAFVVSKPFLLYLMWVITPIDLIPDWFAKLSFPIYLIHGFVLVVFSYVQLPISSTVDPLLRFVMCSLFTIALAQVVRKLFPRFATVVYGGR